MHMYLKIEYGQLILIRIFKMTLKWKYTQTRHLLGKMSLVMLHLFSVLFNALVKIALSSVYWRGRQRFQGEGSIILF